MNHDVIAEVVASGSSTQIERWSELLRKAKIQFEIRRCCDRHKPIMRNHAEIWVERYVVDRARSALRYEETADRP